MICYDHLGSLSGRSKTAFARHETIKGNPTLIAPRKLQSGIKLATSEIAKQTKLNDIAVTIKVWIMNNGLHPNLCLVTI